MAENAGGAPGAKKAEKVKNVVHEQAILVETIKKELREQRICEEFGINPYTKRK
jgi:hypothetical protein